MHFGYNQESHQQNMKDGKNLKNGIFLIDCELLMNYANKIARTFMIV